ncbi:MAG: NAD(P)-binding protein [Thermodesulfobacteriota bacterium]|nr:NAD(P)-binding protein [Thermodesulfobacteriota bacterium]
MNDMTSPDHDRPPCTMACPILTDGREYIQLIAERKFEKAYAAIRGLNPLPRVCGRICTHPCEGACKRGQVDEPIAIAALKRFASDGPWRGRCKALQPAEPTGHKVAVIGSGPAGLAAAHDLALLGHHVTVFEALPVLGGMLRLGVPAYRLPKDVVDEEIEAICDLGVVMKTGVRIGEAMKLKDLFDQQYGAVFVAVGAHQERKLDIAGADAFEGVVSAISFLQRSNSGQNPKVGRQVAVIGGGNTAVDSARSALRWGADAVRILYRRSRDEMPAAPEEIEEAVAEGVHLSVLTSPVEVLGEDGKVTALRCMENRLGQPDANGRRSPDPMAGSEFVLDVDMVIAAIGQAPESSFFAQELELDQRSHRIVVNEAGATVCPGVFAGGDAVTGPATVIQAIAAGKERACAIDLYLKKKWHPVPGPARSDERERLSSAIIEKTRKFERAKKICLPMDRRLKGFEEVEAVLTEDRAISEALRCLHCFLGAKIDKDKCVSCLTCLRVCPLQIPRASKMGEITIDPFECQACGMCALECPVQAIDIDLHPRGDIDREMTAAMSRSAHPDPLMVGFFDLHGDFGPSDKERLRQEHPNILPVMVFGLRRIDTVDILKAFEWGAQVVFLAGCPVEKDPFPETREAVKQRMARTKTLLNALGLDGERLALCHMPKQGLVDKAFIEDLEERVKEMAPNPMGVKRG